MTPQQKWRIENKEKVRKMARDYYYRNKDKISEQARLYRLRNKEKIAARPSMLNNDLSRSRHYKHKYGITLEDYNNILEQQNSVCKICGESEIINSKLSVDHCHTTGKVRGLLCFSCNSGLGKFKENVALLETAIKYLNDNK